MDKWYKIGSALMTENEIKSAFFISTGKSADAPFQQQPYQEFLLRISDHCAPCYTEPDIFDLVLAGRNVRATQKLYRKHGFSIADAREIVNEIDISFNN
jgi:hypothetical protein